MALTAQQKAILNIYLDEIKPNTAAREAISVSDAAAVATLTSWLPTAITYRQNVVAQLQQSMQNVQKELAVLTAKTSATKTI